MHTGGGGGVARGHVQFLETTLNHFTLLPAHKLSVEHQDDDSLKVKKC